jgi:hypothetical protein
MKHIYDFGRRDAIANLFLLIRQNGEKATLKDLAEQLVKSDPVNPNCHAQWYLETHKSHESPLSPS